MKKLIREDNRKPIFKENIEEIEKKLSFIIESCTILCKSSQWRNYDVLDTMDVLDTIDEYYSEAQDCEAKIEEKNCLRSCWNQIISMRISSF